MKEDDPDNPTRRLRASACATPTGDTSTPVRKAPVSLAISQAGAAGATGQINKAVARPEARFPSDQLSLRNGEEADVSVLGGIAGSARVL